MVWMYLLKLVIIIVSVVVINFAIKRILRYLGKKATETKSNWDDIFIKAICSPARALVWIIGISFIWYLSADFIKPLFDSTRIVDYTLETAWLLCGAWLLLRFIGGAEIYLCEKISAGKRGLKDVGGIKAMAKFAQIFVCVVAVLVVLGIFNIPISGIITFGGISGAVLAFSAKDMLSNFFGGLLIYFDRPFAVGDWISSPDKQLEGTVEYIGWRLTRIRSFDKRPIYVPNAIFSNCIVVNPSRMTNRRIKQNIDVRYEDSPKLLTVLADIKKMLNDHNEIDQTKSVMVNIVSFDPSYITFMIYAFTKTTNWAKYLMVQDDVLIRAHGIIKAHGAECAFPTTTLSVPDGVDIRVAQPPQPIKQARPTKKELKK